jgi:hypothetical protein
MDKIIQVHSNWKLRYGDVDERGWPCSGFIGYTVKEFNNIIPKTNHKFYRKAKSKDRS